MTQITFSINIFYTDFIFIAKVVIHLVDDTRDLYFMAGCTYCVIEKDKINEKNITSFEVG